MLTLALLMAAGLVQGAPAVPSAPAQQGPWLDLSVGPAFLHRDDTHGLSSGPLVRLGLGAALTDFAAGEVWVSGVMQSAPLSTPGDTAVAAAGLGARLRLHRFDPDGKLALWARVGAGFQGAAAGDARSGPTGFAGAQLLFQPFVQRFALGLEMEAIGERGAVGFALLPSLRAAL